MAAVPSPQSSYSLRLAEAGDFDAYMDAFEAVAAEGRWMGAEAPIDRVARRAGFDRAVARDDAVLFLAEADGAVVGSIYAGLSGGVVDLGMFVAAGHRGAGIGSALLEAVIDWARVQDAHKVSLAVWPTNYPAIGLYARYGFRVEGVRRRHYRRRSGELWEAIWMGLILDDDTPGGPGRPKSQRPSIVIPEGGIRGAASGAAAGASGTRTAAGGAAAASGTRTAAGGAAAASGIRAAAAGGTADGGAAGSGAAAGGGVVLREWHRADIPALLAAIDDPEIRRVLPHIPNPYTTSDAEEYIARTRVDLTAGTTLATVIEVDGALAGSIDLGLLDGFDGLTAEIGYWVAEFARGRGVATAATHLLADYGFNRLGLQRIELNVALNNPASARVAENAGFELEGVRRAWRTVAGVPTDFFLYARVAGPGAHPPIGSA
jgi:RimJ/RimL family protein N-acetyltransferase